MTTITDFVSAHPIKEIVEGPIVCGCGKGHASEYDGLCKFCREDTVSRSVAKRVGVRYSGDGMCIDAMRVLKGEVKRKDVYI